VFVLPANASKKALSVGPGGCVATASPVVSQALGRFPLTLAGVLQVKLAIVVDPPYCPGGGFTPTCSPISFPGPRRPHGKAGRFAVAR
jgi:hypothetical protein